MRLGLRHACQSSSLVLTTHRLRTCAHETEVRWRAWARERGCRVRERLRLGLSLRLRERVRPSVRVCAV